MLILLFQTEKDGFAKGCALIRANLHTDPLAGSDEDWAHMSAQALWLENWRQKRQAEMLVHLFGADMSG